jgi:hypothetical protein
MKFNEIEEKEWVELQPYLDTCLLPVTGMSGREQPWEATRELEKLRDALDAFELPYRGRVVTYPALHYTEDYGKIEEILDNLGKALKETGFRFVVIVTASERIGSMVIPSADLMACIHLEPGDESVKEQQKRLGFRLEELWNVSFQPTE